MSTHNATPDPKKFNRNGHLRWLKVADLVIDPQAQRQLRQGHAARIAANFDPDAFGIPVVSERDGRFYTVDGNHRIAALRLMGWDDQMVQCWVKPGTQSADAHLFLLTDNRRAITSFDKFRIAVTAGHETECDIQRIVLAQGLKVASGAGGVYAVKSLVKVYESGPGVLARALRIAYGAYCDAGLSGHVLEGIGLVVARYGNELDPDHAIARLSAARGGINRLTQLGNTYRKQFGMPMASAYANAVVEILNAGRGGKKLAPYMRPTVAAGDSPS